MTTTILGTAHHLYKRHKISEGVVSFDEARLTFHPGGGMPDQILRATYEDALSRVNSHCLRCCSFTILLIYIGGVPESLYQPCNQCSLNRCYIWVDSTAFRRPPTRHEASIVLQRRGSRGKVPNLTSERKLAVQRLSARTFLSSVMGPPQVLYRGCCAVSPYNLPANGLVLQYRS